MMAATKPLSLDHRAYLETIAFKKDPAFWAKEVLHWENRIGKMDRWQESALNSMQNSLWNCTRQAGKSTTAAAKGLHKAIFYPKSLILLVSPSQRQSSELFRKVHDHMSMMDLPPRLLEDNRLSCTLENGSRIVSLPGEEKTIRGFSAPALIIEDEAARVDDALFFAIRPMLAISHGQIIMMSTPFGKRGHFFQEWTFGGDYWSRTMVPATDIPRISQEFLEEERRILKEIWFRQEYLCEFIDNNPDALWTREIIDNLRVTSHPDLVRIVVGVDPSVTGKETSDETGIITAGIAANGHIYVLSDDSLRASPNTWAATVARVFRKHSADRVIGEVNQGGDMVELTLRTVDRTIPFKGVHANRGKLLRAEPISALYEQGRVHHVGAFPELEDQMCLWAPGDSSPDRLDALVYAISELANRTVSDEKFAITGGKHRT